jgi:hypothetical protein
MRNRIPEVT